jgi:hypothetical protein
MSMRDGKSKCGKTAIWLGLFLVVFSSGPVAQASGPDETALDATALIQLEQQADKAKPRDQCYLYTELLHALTESAGREVAAGQSAEATVQHISAVMAKVDRASARDTKKLKDAEELLAHTTRRLQDMSRLANGEERQKMQGVLKALNAVHAHILNLVFAQ